jgi:enterochelin esterase-like enzyme
VAEDVTETAAHAYGIPVTREKWGMGGFSFGGFVSLDVGRRYASRFGSISAIRAFFDEEWLFWPDPIPVPGNLDSNGRGKQSIIVTGPIPKLLLACGRRDRFYKRMRQLHGEWLGLGIAHEWSVESGGHTWAYWSSVLERMLEFHLGYL